MHIRPAAFIAIIKSIVSRLKFVPMTENVRFDLKKDDFHLLGTHPNARLAGALETVLEEWQAQMETKTGFVMQNKEVYLIFINYKHST